MRYVRVVNTVAVELYDTPEGVFIVDCFYPTIAVQFVEAPESVAAGDVLNADGSWSSSQTEQTEQPAVEPVVEQTEPSVIS